MNKPVFLKGALLIILLIQLSTLTFAQTATVINKYDKEILNLPASVVADSKGIVYVTSMATHTVCKLVPPSKKLEIIATEIANPRGLALSPDGLYLYVGSGSSKANDALTKAPNSGHCIYRITLADGSKKLFAGSGGQSGSANGPALSAAHFNEVADLLCDKAGNVYVADRFNGDVRKITVKDQNNFDNNLVSTFISGNQGSFSGDRELSQGAVLGLNSLSGIAFDEVNNIFYLADRGNSRIRKVNLKTGGKISTLAGNGTVLDTEPGDADNNVLATTVALSNGLYGVSLDVSGNIYFTDAGKDYKGNVNRVRKVDFKTGKITSYLGASNSKINIVLQYPSGVYIVPGTNTMYVTNHYGSTIVKVKDIDIL